MFCQPARERATLFSRRRMVAKAVAKQALDSGRGRAMKKKYQMSEREYRGRLEGLLKSAFNAQLQPLRSLQTVTKKRRALKKKAVKNSGFTNSSTTAS